MFVPLSINKGRFKVDLRIEYTDAKKLDPRKNRFAVLINEFSAGKLPLIYMRPSNLHKN